MPINVYMIFNGNCQEAVEYYAKVFDADMEEISRFGDMPAEPGQEMPDEQKNLVMHTSLDIYGSTVMFSDAMPNSSVVFGKNINVTVVSGELEKMAEDFKRLGQDGTVQMEMQETFWSAAYGVVEDPYGVVWQFSHDDGSYKGGTSDN